MDDLVRRSLTRTAVFVVILLLLLLLPAGSLRFWQGWMYWAVFSASVVAITLYFLRHDPALIARRLNGGPTAEKQPVQRQILWFTSAFFVLLFVFPGFDHRFAWSRVPAHLVIAANVLVVAGFAIVFLTFKANSYTAAIIDVAPEQPLVSTGPYGVVRHPMYAGSLVMLLATPIALGSWWGLLPALCLVACIVWRIVAEEEFLVRHLPGYAEYRQRVRYRLVPGIW